jgi:uncharacterized protein (TIGR00297 family)
LKASGVYVTQIPSSDWYWTGITLVSIFGLLIFIEIATRRWGWNRTVTRKSVHLLVGLLICITPFIFSSKVPLTILSVLFVGINWWAIKTHHLTGIHPDNQSYGTVFYPVAILILTQILWPEYKIIFILSTLLLVIADAMAALIGNNFASTYYVLYEERKSIPGSATMFGVSVILLFTGSQMFISSAHFAGNLLMAVLVGLVATGAELLSKKGSDNVSVPLITALFLYGFVGAHGQNVQTQLAAGIILALLTAALSYRFHFLKLNGAIVTFMLGSIIFGFGGLQYTVPILVFFILSSLVSKTGKQKKKELAGSFEKSDIRDMYQVLANGGMAGILVVLIFVVQQNTWYPYYLVAVAVATADTWATELGIFSRSMPRLITNFRQVPSGYSGAVSFLGSIAAAGGSLIILISGLYFLNRSGQSTSPVVFTVLFFGFTGSFIDSVLGATVQAQYRCTVCQKNTEKRIHCQHEAQLIRGYAWLTNDWINFLSIFLATLLSFTFLNLI